MTLCFVITFDIHIHNITSYGYKLMFYIKVKL